LSGRRPDQPTKTFPASFINSLAFSGNNRWLVAVESGSNGSPLLWDVSDASGAKPRTLTHSDFGQIRQTQIVRPATTTRDGRWLVYGIEKRLYVWRLDGLSNGTPPVAVKDLDERIGGLAISPDDRWLAVYDRESAAARLFDLADLDCRSGACGFESRRPRSTQTPHP